MKTNQIFLTILMMSLSFSLCAKTVCSMTFNSSNEREVFKKHLAPLGYEFKELVPINKDPNWLLKQCESIKSCDLLIISGHFGGLFFGEQLSTTLSLQDMAKYSKNPICQGIFKNPKSVFLMGCNTLSQKTPDHRSVTDYLRVLVGDGFPLNLAEEVAASRYLDFGTSMANQMMSLFNSSKSIIGFESTGPLGAQAAPRLEQAFKNSSRSTKLESGIDLQALKNAFSSTNLRIVNPIKNNVDDIKAIALSSDGTKSTRAWISLLTDFDIKKNYDFFIENSSNEYLLKVLSSNPVLLKKIGDSFIQIRFEATGLAHVQVKVLKALLHFNIVNIYEYEDSLKKIVNQISNRNLDYVSADQLCSMLKNNQDLNLLTSLTSENYKKVSNSPFFNYMKKCAGELVKPSSKKVDKCLENRENHDWGCLTSNEKELTINACKLAKSRNTDPENSDDMMWFCYSKMLENNQITQADCMELTHQFSLLGNQIKMNWNCTNKLK